MHTFPAATLGQPLQTNAARQSGGAGTIIARALLSLGMTLLLALGGCSTVRLAYNQAPTLAYFWFNDYLELSAEQAAPFKRDLDGFFQWHRMEELPLYAKRLKHWQTMATGNVTPEQACAQFEILRTAYLRGVDQALPRLTRVALSLQAPQFEALIDRQAKSNRKFEKEWLQGTHDDQQARRLTRTVERYEDLYGKLTAPQMTLLKTFAQRSVFDPVRLHTERLRRQGDLNASLKEAQAQPGQAQGILRAWHDRLMRSPDPVYAAHSTRNTEENCAQFAELHQTTSPEQRAHAVKTLQGYEDDLTALGAQH